MTDAGLFAFGCVVFLVAALGTFLFLYTRFRAEYVRENARDWAEEARPREPARGVVPARELDVARR
jgi:hypothetical protein